MTFIIQIYCIIINEQKESAAMGKLNREQRRDLLGGGGALGRLYICYPFPGDHRRAIFYR